MKKSKNEIGVLRLKLIKNDLEIAKQEFSAGLRDLNEILSEFQKKISSTQKEKYGQFFFGKPTASQTKKQSDTQSETSTQIDVYTSNIDDKKKQSVELPDWIKKIYRKIMQSTHPDKYINFPVESIKEKYLKIYRDTVDAVNSNDLGVILLCAYEANIDIDNKESNLYIEKSYNEKAKEITEIKKLLAYQWYHITDDMRPNVLKNYLIQLGFTFTEE